MLSSHFKILFRRLWKKRSFSLLNIIGLSVGIAASLLIFLVIRYETGYDAYQSKYNLNEGLPACSLHLFQTCKRRTHRT